MNIWVPGGAVGAVAEPWEVEPYRRKWALRFEPLLLPGQSLFPVSLETQGGEEPWGGTEPELYASVAAINCVPSNLEPK